MLFDDAHILFPDDRPEDGMCNGDFLWRTMEKKFKLGVDLPTTWMYPTNTHVFQSPRCVFF